MRDRQGGAGAGTEASEPQLGPNGFELDGWLVPGEVQGEAAGAEQPRDDAQQAESDDDFVRTFTHQQGEQEIDAFDAYESHQPVTEAMEGMQVEYAWAENERDNFMHALEHDDDARRHFTDNQ